MEEWFCGRWEWYLRDLPKSILFHCSAAVLATEPRDSIYLLRPCVSSLPRLRQKNGRRFSERLRWVCFGHLWNFFAWSHRSFLSACFMDGNLLRFSKCMCSRCEIANMHIKTKKNHFQDNFQTRYSKDETFVDNNYTELCLQGCSGYQDCFFLAMRPLKSLMTIFIKKTFEDFDDHFHQ